MRRYFGIAVEGGFERVDIDKMVGETKIDSRSLSLFLFDGKRTVFEGDAIVDTGTCKGKTTNALGMLRMRIAVEETIKPRLPNHLLFAMAMEIDDSSHPLILV